MVKKEKGYNAFPPEIGAILEDSIILAQQQGCEWDGNNVAKRSSHKPPLFPLFLLLVP